MHIRFAGLAGVALLCLPFTAHAEYVGDYAVGTDNICKVFNTYQPSTGASFAIAAEEVDVYKDDGTTQDNDSGLTIDDDFDGLTGAHQVCVDTSSDGTFYSAGSIFTVVVSVGTVDSVSVVGTEVMTFSLAKSATFARLGAPAGASHAADILAIDNFVDDLETRLGTPSNLGGGTSTLAANMVDIEAQTDDIGTAGAGLTNIDLPNQTMDISGTITTVGTVNALANNSITDAASAADFETRLQTEAADALNAEDGGNFTEVSMSTAGVNEVLLGQGIPAPTTIATLASQTSFTLTAGSADDNAYNGYGIVIRDASTAAQQALGCVRDYTGSSKTVTLLADPGIFTMATSDNVLLLPAFCDSQVQQDLVDTALLNCEVNTANFAGSTTTLACILTDQAGAAVTSATGDLTGLEVRVLSGAQRHEGRFINTTTWDAGNSELQITLSRALPATLADGVIAIIR